MAIDRPVLAPEPAGGTTALAVPAPVARGAAVEQTFPTPIFPLIGRGPAFPD